jgi:hypothetical protein
MNLVTLPPKLWRNETFVVPVRLGADRAASGRTFGRSPLSSDYGTYKTVKARFWHTQDSQGQILAVDSR